MSKTVTKLTLQEIIDACDSLLDAGFNIPEIQGPRDAVSVRLRERVVELHAKVKAAVHIANEAGIIDLQKLMSHGSWIEDPTISILYNGKTHSARIKQSIRRSCHSLHNYRT